VFSTDLGALPAEQAILQMAEATRGVLTRT